MNFDFYDCYGFLIELLLVQTAFLWKAPKKICFRFVWHAVLSATCFLRWQFISFLFRAGQT